MIAEIALAGWVLQGIAGCALSGFNSPDDRTYVNNKTGEIYCGTEPPTESSLASQREFERQRDKETVRYCLREPYGGTEAVTGIICTGYYDPELLRSGKSHSEGVIKEILNEDRKFGVTYPRK